MLLPHAMHTTAACVLGQGHQFQSNALAELLFMSHSWAQHSAFHHAAGTICEASHGWLACNVNSVRLSTSASMTHSLSAVELLVLGMLQTSSPFSNGESGTARAPAPLGSAALSGGMGSAVLLVRASLCCLAAASGADKA